MSQIGEYRLSAFGRGLRGMAHKFHFKFFIKLFVQILLTGCGTIVVGNFQVAFWSIACERQTRRLREALFRSILHKETSYFDTNKTGQLNTRLTEDVNKVHDGTGDKVGSALQFFSAFIV
ncbi:unnamed protein product [Rotaria sp. Silwood2]|nr:unnamed protein product [Rotaria sp. Silwood2]